jgi:hypothetical protein
MTVLNRIREVQAPNHGELVRPLKYIVLHKTGISIRETHNPDPVPDDEADVLEMAARFCRGGLAHYTGGLFPYHLVVRRDGVIEQALPLDVPGAHAVGVNHQSIGLAFIGDGDDPATPTTAQYAALIRCAVDLVLLERCSMIGHTDITWASADPSKRCPGPGLPMPKFVVDVREKLPLDWRLWDRLKAEQLLTQHGFQLTAAVRP